MILLKKFIIAFAIAFPISFIGCCIFYLFLIWVDHLRPITHYVTSMLAPSLKLSFFMSTIGALVLAATGRPNR
jgi:hypothetical protein